MRRRSRVTPQYHEVTVPGSLAEYSAVLYISFAGACFERVQRNARHVDMLFEHISGLFGTRSNRCLILVGTSGQPVES